MEFSFVQTANILWGAMATGVVTAFVFITLEWRLGRRLQESLADRARKDAMALERSRLWIEALRELRSDLYDARRKCFDLADPTRLALADSASIVAGALALRDRLDVLAEDAAELELAQVRGELIAANKALEEAGEAAARVPGCARRAVRPLGAAVAICRIHTNGAV